MKTSYHQFFNSLKPNEKSDNVSFTAKLNFSITSLHSTINSVGVNVISILLNCKGIKWQIILKTFNSFYYYL